MASAAALFDKDTGPSLNTLLLASLHDSRHDFVFIADAMDTAEVRQLLKETVSPLTFPLSNFDATSDDNWMEAAGIVKGSGVSQGMRTLREGGWAAEHYLDFSLDHGQLDMNTDNTTTFEELMKLVCQPTPDNKYNLVVDTVATPIQTAIRDYVVKQEDTLVYVNCAETQFDPSTQLTVVHGAQQKMVTNKAGEATAARVAKPGMGLYIPSSVTNHTWNANSGHLKLIKQENRLDSSFYPNLKHLVLAPGQKGAEDSETVQEAWSALSGGARPDAATVRAVQKRAVCRIPGGVPTYEGQPPDDYACDPFNNAKFLTKYDILMTMAVDPPIEDDSGNWRWDTERAYAMFRDPDTGTTVIADKEFAKTNGTRTMPPGNHGTLTDWAKGIFGKLFKRPFTRELPGSLSKVEHKAPRKLDAWHLLSKKLGDGGQSLYALDHPRSILITGDRSLVVLSMLYGTPIIIFNNITHTTVDNSTVYYVDPAKVAKNSYSIFVRKDLQTTLLLLNSALSTATILQKGLRDPTRTDAIASVTTNPDLILDRFDKESGDVCGKIQDIAQSFVEAMCKKVDFKRDAGKCTKEAQEVVDDANKLWRELVFSVYFMLPASIEFTAYASQQSALSSLEERLDVTKSAKELKAAALSAAKVFPTTVVVDMPTVLANLPDILALDQLTMGHFHNGVGLLLEIYKSGAEEVAQRTAAEAKARIAHTGHTKSLHTPAFAARTQELREELDRYVSKVDQYLAECVSALRGLTAAVSQSQMVADQLEKLEDARKSFLPNDPIGLFELPPLTLSRAYGYVSSTAHNADAYPQAAGAPVTGATEKIIRGVLPDLGENYVGGFHLDTTVPDIFTEGDVLAMCGKRKRGKVVHYGRQAAVERGGTDVLLAYLENTSSISTGGDASSKHPMLVLRSAIKDVVRRIFYPKQADCSGSGADPSVYPVDEEWVKSQRVLQRFDLERLFPGDYNVVNSVALVVGRRGGGVLVGGMPKWMTPWASPRMDSLARAKETPPSGRLGRATKMLPSAFRARRKAERERDMHVQRQTHTQTLTHTKALVEAATALLDANAVDKTRIPTVASPSISVAVRSSLVASLAALSDASDVLQTVKLWPWDDGVLRETMPEVVRDIAEMGAVLGGRTQHSGVTLLDLKLDNAKSEYVLHPVKSTALDEASDIRKIPNVVADPYYSFMVARGPVVAPVASTEVAVQYLTRRNPIGNMRGANLGDVSAAYKLLMFLDKFATVLDASAKKTLSGTIPVSAPGSGDNVMLSGEIVVPSNVASIQDLCVEIMAWADGEGQSADPTVAIRAGWAAGIESLVLLLNAQVYFSAAGGEEEEVEADEMAVGQAVGERADLGQGTGDQASDPMVGSPVSGPKDATTEHAVGDEASDPMVGSPLPDPMVGSPLPDPMVGSPLPDPMVGSPLPDPMVGSPLPDVKDAAVVGEETITGGAIIRLKSRANANRRSRKIRKRTHKSRKRTRRGKKQTRKSNQPRRRGQKASGKGRKRLLYRRRPRSRGRRRHRWHIRTLKKR